MSLRFEGEELRSGESAVVVTATGFWDGFGPEGPGHAADSPFHQRMQAYFDAGLRLVVVDCAGLTGWTELAPGETSYWADRFRDSGGDLRLARVPERIRTVIRLLDMERWAQSYDTVADALAAPLLVDPAPGSGKD